MLQKSRSKKIWKFKYLLIVPLIIGMLFYSSCEQEDPVREVSSLQDKITEITREIESKEALTDEEKQALQLMIVQSYTNSNEGLTQPQREIIEEQISNLLDGRISFIDHFFNDGKLDANIEILTDSYNQLVQERQRLLNNAIYKTPILDQELTTLNKKIFSAVEVPFAVIDEVPVFPGCEDAADQRACFNEKIQTHVRKHFRYPQAAQEAGIQGKVYVRFVVGKDGSITDIKKRGPNPILEAEVERIISKLPRMKPGKQGGEPVNVPFSLPVVFKLK